MSEDLLDTTLQAERGLEGRGALARFLIWAIQAPEGVKSLSFSVTVTVVCMAILFGLRGDFYDSMFVFAMTFAIVVVGMVLQVGYSHQLAFHQSVFMMAAAYGVAILSAKNGVPVWIAMIVVVIGCGVVGFLIGAYVTRVPGFALALATLFFSVIVVGAVEYNSYLGAQTGLGPVPYVIGGASYIRSLEYSGAVGIVLLGISIYVVSRIMNSSVGLELVLMASNERMAEGLGIYTARRKLELFVLGSVFAGLGGAVFATTQQFVTPSTFSQTAEITFLVMLFLGGRASLFGALLGTVGIQYLSGTSNFVANNQGIIEGVLITAVLLFAPAGFIGVLRAVAKPIWSVVTRWLALEAGEGVAAARLVSSDPQPAASVGSGPGGGGVAAASGSLRRSSGATAVAEAGSGGFSAGSLECRNLVKAFGGVVAVDSVSLEIRGPGIFAICGPNGAGKTTLFELIAGGLRADAGEVFIGGREVTHLMPHQRAELGLARTLQAVRLMNTRTVLDNVAVAALESHRTWMTGAVFSSGLREARERAREALRSLGIEGLAERRAGQLTLEMQRMVELARAMVAHPQLVLLDEPASGLSVEQRDHVSRTLEELAVHTTVVLVEHDLQMVARIAKDIFVLIDGRLVFQGDSTAFQTAEVVRSELMGLVGDEQLLETVAPLKADELA